MANPITQIILSAVDRTKAAFASARDGLRGVKKDADEASSGIELSGSKLTGLLSRFGLGIGAALSLKSIGGLADEFANLQARLKLASRDTAEYNQANKDLERIAAAAKVPLSETAQLYTRIAASVKDLDVSQSQVADTTEAVALALKISGATAAESSSAMLQFSQAIASGVLRGEEFNAINESAPRLLQALAESLNVPVGALRDMAKEGQLTRDVIINGLLKALPKLQREAESLPDTIGSAWTNLKNEILLTVGAFDDATRASKAVADATSTIGSAGVKALAVAAAGAYFTIAAVGRTLNDAVRQLAALARLDFKGIQSIGSQYSKDIGDYFKRLDDFIKRTSDGDKKVSDARKANSADIADVLKRDTKEVAKAYKDSIKEQISDANRLQSALISAFDTALKTETDYLRQAKKLRDEASGKTTVGDDPESQALGRLTAITTAMKLQRDASSASLETVQGQAEALRNLAEQLDDAALKSDLLKQANLSEATAFEKAAAEESARAKGLAAQQDENTRRLENMKAAIEGIGKEVSVDIKPGAQMEKTKQDLTEIKHLIDYIKANPVSIDVTGGGSADALKRAALQHGRRQ